MRWLPLLAVAIVGCSGGDPAPLVEYPDPPAPALPAEDDAGKDGAAPADAADDASEPLAGKKLLATNVSLEGVTTDGHLVLFVEDDLAVWPRGASAPVTVAKDYDFGFDSRLVRGRFVGAWLGAAPGATPLVIWSAKAGTETLAPLAFRDAIYARPASDDLAYLAPGASFLKRHVRATTAGAGAGVTVVEDLDSGLTNSACRPTVAYGAAALVVAGCTGGATTPRVATFALDGSGVAKVVLDASAPGLWLDRAGARAVVQTAGASSIRALAGAAAPVPLDTPLRQAGFSADDTKIIYRRADGKIRRANTTAPTSPVDLLDEALAILAMSSDARFVVAATSGDPSRDDSDLVVADATSPAAAPRTLAAEKAALIGLSRSGDRVVYLKGRGLALAGELEVALLPGGAPVRLSEDAMRVAFDGDVVYWQELDAATKTNVLKAARVTAPKTVITIDDGLDPLTAHAVRAGDALFVGSKHGLWEYPALAP
jgi:hypothetical protein